VPLRLLIAALLLLARASLCFGQDQKHVIPPAATAACAQFDPAPIANSDMGADEALQDRLLAVYNMQARLVRSLKGVATVRATHISESELSGGKRRDLTAFINFELPALIRVTGRKRRRVIRIQDRHTHSGRSASVPQKLARDSAIDARVVGATRTRSVARPPIVAYGAHWTAAAEETAGLQLETIKFL